jgi:hypothetical protein
MSTSGKWKTSLCRFCITWHYSCLTTSIIVVPGLCDRTDVFMVSLVSSPRMHGGVLVDVGDRRRGCLGGVSATISVHLWNVARVRPKLARSGRASLLQSHRSELNRMTFISRVGRCSLNLVLLYQSDLRVGFQPHALRRRMDPTHAIFHRAMDPDLPPSVRLRDMSAG